MKNNNKNRKLKLIRDKNNFRKGMRCRDVVVVSDDFLRETSASLWIEKAIIESVNRISKKFRLPVRADNITSGKIADEWRNDFTQNTTTILFDILPV